jgi:hypothetical protein
VAPKGGGLPKVVIAAAVVFVLAFGLGIGLVLGSRGDDGGDQENASATEPADDEAEGAGPDDTETQDESDPFGDFGDEPGGEPSDEDPFGGMLPDDLLEQLPEGWEDLIPDDLLDDLSNLDDLSDLEGFEDFGDLGDFEIPEAGAAQVTILFEDDAPERRVQRIRTAFDQSAVIGYVTYLDADNLDDLMGESLPPGALSAVLTAFGAGGDPDATRDFACSFSDDPAVQVVQVFGADPCDQSL